MTALIRLLALTILLTSTAALAQPRPSSARLITLEDAYDLALASDQSIAIAQLGIQQAQLDPARAWVKLTPTISADAGISARDSRNAAGRRSTNSGGITLSQPIFDPTFFPALRRGKLAVAAAGADYQRQIRETLFGVAQAYYDVLTQQEIVEVDKESLRLAAEQQDIAQARLDAGDTTRSDPLRAQVTTETARRTLIEDTSTLESLRNILANILNLDNDLNFRVALPPGHKTTIPRFDYLLRDALTQREDIRSQDLLIRQNDERIKEVRSSYLPSISANVDASTSDQSGGNPRFENDVQGSLSLRVPLYSAGQKAIDVRAATLDAQQSRLQQQQLIKQVEQEVKDAWLDARRLSETLNILRVQVQAAEVSYAELQERYKSGDAANLDVLTALNELITSRRDLTVETYRLQLSLRNLERVSSTFQTDRVRKVQSPTP
ncbi:hypothetical protein FEM03_03680 [Phragmitibacter flavus]|uniref:TolC family protein n=1 Tax=Phragmitibacter flavus TaxID=2576071 RepID=A0A5R8KKJ3_9BACT|nr:TolC family protein [Phragmitibacter flavus]TLD72465.1 hypothetical protein FEM03_03680 [Phragmitibacter flavus]